MKLVIQRVASACVSVDDKVVGQINQGLLVLLGIGHNDSEIEIDWAVKKITELRIFQDNEDKMNLCLKDIEGSVLVISQFTLYADANKGRRPSFVRAAKAELAIPVYESLIQKLRGSGILTQCGIFGAKMSVSLVNEGPVTIILESEEA